MKAEELIAEIRHQRALQETHKKLLRKIELQIAGFGSHVPPHIEVEKENLETKIQVCDEQIREYKDQAIAIKQDELNAFQSMLQVLSNDAAIVWVISVIYAELPITIPDFNYQTIDMLARNVRDMCNERIRQLEDDIQNTQHM
jgi:hypothetical protein